MAYVLLCSAPPLLKGQVCSDEGLKGVYGFAGSGLVPEPSRNGMRFVPLSDLAVVTYDGEGKIAVQARIQYHGKLSSEKLSGTYGVGRDCTGTASFRDPDGAIILTWNFFVVHGGEEIETLEVRPATPTRPMYSLIFTQNKR
jgi:hypothetical protein